MKHASPERLAYLRLARTEGLGPVTIKRLVERCGSAEKAVEAVPVMSAKGGRVKELASLDAIHKELDHLDKRNTLFLCPADKDYPFLLSQISDAPIILTYRGDTKLLQKDMMLGVVGARNSSVNASRFTQKLCSEIGQAGASVVSGLARGIDTAAHNGSLKTGTVAVVAGGLDNIYPAENQKLADEIAEKGCIVSEEPLTLAPMATHFPKRNRIIAGLSHAVLVVEATLRSGSLITARLAGEYGRDVLAIPGFPLDPRAEGPNHLIKDGAILISETQDILDALRQPKIKADAPFTLNERSVSDVLYNEEDTDDLRERILSSLSSMPISLDDLAAACACNPQQLSLPLLELELSGAIRYASHNRIVLGKMEPYE